MKIRLNFVSNSSSSSYICEISGEVESGYDAGMRELGFCQCEKGHIFKEEYLKPTDIEEIDKIEFTGEYNDIYEELPPKYCPICTFEYITNDIISDYLFYINNTDRETISNEIKSKFKNYDDFKEFLLKEKEKWKKR